MQLFHWYDYKYYAHSPPLFSSLLSVALVLAPSPSPSSPPSLFSLATSASLNLSCYEIGPQGGVPAAVHPPISLPLGNSVAVDEIILFDFAAKQTARSDPSRMERADQVLGEDVRHECSSRVPLSLLRSLYCARSLVLSSSRAPSSFLPPRAPLLLLFSRIVFLPSSPHSFCPPLVSPSRPPSSMAVLLTRWNDLGERPVHVPHPIESFVRSDADETFHHRWLRYSYCFFFHSTTPAVIVFLFIY